MLNLPIKNKTIIMIALIWKMKENALQINTSSALSAPSLSSSLKLSSPSPQIYILNG